MSSSPELAQKKAMEAVGQDTVIPASKDERTVDGKPLYIQVTILEPEVTEKDGEKFMVYPLSTEVCYFPQIPVF